jgi:23S rRNA pseudouridine1911/1915/1917 synthase
VTEEPQETVLEIAVPPGQAPGVRLDVYLTEKMANATRAKVQRGIRDGRVSVNGRVETRPSYGVQPGDDLECRVLRSPPIDVLPEAIPLSIVHEDDHLLVVDKPAGMVVHPAYGHRSGTLVNALLHHVGAGPVRADPDSPDEDDDEIAGLSTVGAGPRYEGDPTVRPGLVHRLDRDTTGLMVIAKNDVSHAALARQFADRTIRRRYLAIVWGVPAAAQGRMESWLGRDARDRKKVSVVPEGRGKWAATTYERLESLQYTAVVRFRLETGRTHQIRVHAAHMGHPVFGDRTYGGDRVRYGPDTGARRAFLANLLEVLPRQALHAQTLGFRHPATGEDLDFEAAVPSDMTHVLERLRAVESAG